MATMPRYKGIGMPKAKKKAVVQLSEAQDESSDPPGSSGRVPAYGESRHDPVMYYSTVGIIPITSEQQTRLALTGEN